MEFTLLFAAAIAAASGALALKWEAARGNAVDCASDLWDLFLSGAFIGVFVGRVASMIGSSVNPITNPSDLLIIRGGVATGPAALAAILAVGVIGRHEIVAVFDALAVAALAGLGGWHLGCLVRAACLGTATDLPWAMTQPGSGIGRHPVELYTAAIFLIAAAALGWIRKRRLASGVAAGTALLVASVGRLVTEPLRLGLTGGPAPWYVAGGLIGLGGIVWSYRHVRSA